MLKTACVWLTTMSLLVLAGCGEPVKWEITVENKNAAPCSVSVTLSHSGPESQSNSEASVGDVKSLGKVVLLVGEQDQTIRTVKVVRGGEEELLEPNAALRAGQRYRIVIPETGKTTAAVE